MQIFNCPGYTSANNVIDSGDVTKESAVLSIGENMCFGELKCCSKTRAAVARLDRAKLLPAFLVHKCSFGIVIAYDEELE